jgi:hypothetical protein
MSKNEDRTCVDCKTGLEECAINIDGIWVKGFRCPKCGLEVPTKESYMEALYTKRGDASARWIK